MPLLTLDSLESVYVNMCGIYGIWHRHGKPVDLSALQIATNRLRHRGPDDEGYLLANPATGVVTPYAGSETDRRLMLPSLDKGWSDGCSLAFGFRRLAILDLSPAGHQPMASADRRFWIVFNGEIYNFIELREELQCIGHRFHSSSDTEVILAAYAQWGEKCLDRLNGMWAFAIWDRERRRLFLARDRFGIKPLYYAVIGPTFAFASEIKSLIGPHALPFKPEPAAIYQFLTDGNLPSPQHGATFFAGVHVLPAGHYLKVDLTSPIQPQRYYRIPVADESHRSRRVDDIIADYRDLFFDAVRLELRSDVTVGSCLSGGVDSSSIVCAVNRLLQQNDCGLVHIGQQQKTFSAVYDSEGRYNERQHIEKVLRATAADGHFVVPTAERLHADLEKLTWHQEEPFQSTSIFAQWCVMSIARECGVTVLLDGQGADELLAGYRPYAHYLADLLRQTRWATFAREALLVCSRSGQSVLPLLRRTAIYAMPAPIPALAFYCRRQVAHRQLPVLRADFAAACRRVASAPLSSWYEQDSLDRHLRDAIAEVSLPHLLRYEDRNSMAFSIESRVPFLDHRLVEFVFRQAPHLRIWQGWTKWVHRQAMTGIVPAAIAWRSDKVGFETPEVDWQRRLLTMRPDLFTGNTHSSEYLDLPVVRRAIAQWLQHGGDTRRIWRWISLEVWLSVWYNAAR
ncbi:asparagine synthase (glutamine-hydrolyzing) [Chloroflexus sp.]|uniref:asparagine synthase (glutamine-hydrolyzing) n=1 Tax=Chloroflexus sp. TaxID=1904827 RepID=UPI00298F2B3E|nr:asparagine synthase (glutamine-hydrolyzing) [Chloroflexus sp.]MDW8403891.1 asparagine synthase (glutamine-hydrolyzing) [Chloroflexus sp.]